MFVLGNAWRALTRSKGRTALTAFITLAVTFGTVAGLAIVQENTTAHTTTYDSQKATMAIRPSAAAWKKVSATDSSTTKQYMTWTAYTEYATAIQSATNTLDFTVTETVPARVSGNLKALDGDSLNGASDDKTGGQLLWRAFWTRDAAKANNLGTYTIVDGKGLSFNNQSSNPDTTGALVSSAFAKANNLKVGDTFKVATAADKSKTAELKVRGIYEYTSEADADNPVVTARNRENAIYTNYQTFASADLDPQSSDSSAKGWQVPDLDIVFNLSDAATYKSVVASLKKSKLPAKGYTISSPSLDEYTKSLAPLETLASRAQTGVILLLSVGGVLLLALVLLGVWAPKRDDEIGMALVSGVTRGRLGWQFMLEVFIVTLPFYAIGLVGGAFAAKPIGAALASGHATAVTSDLVWKMVWYGLGTILVLAILAALRLAFYGSDKLFAADGDWGTVSETEVIEAESGAVDGAGDDAAATAAVATTTTTTGKSGNDAEAKA
ncbi:ABC transporter permease [Bifidobacterium callitrichidarum]|uniref:ABC transporter permease n=1 Tax=Bifidobacterium callitrichidarum TaxID=2052941 RepID=A0A2U2N9R5_9BIFI|nr:ABC transporter permease [Bifidobacterium callitrichidarum]PWG65921.1 ABC transporter permease [Bifidobacterium callitrichidarum]